MDDRINLHGIIGADALPDDLRAHGCRITHYHAEPQCPDRWRYRVTIMAPRGGTVTGDGMTLEGAIDHAAELMRRGGKPLGT